MDFETEFCRAVGRFDRAVRLPLSVAKGHRFQGARSVGHDPFCHVDRIDWLAPERFVVEEQLDLVAIRIRTNLDRLTFSAGPVPMRQQMHEWLACEPGAVKMKRILRKSAG